MKPKELTFILVCFTAMLALCNAECCDNAFYPFTGCRGVGPCNIFCCNCDYGCVLEYKEASHGKRPKPNKLPNPAHVFKQVDKDKNGKISFEEALAHAIKYDGGKNDELKKDRKWFESMDIDDDGFIEPHEFDKSLEH